MKRPGQDWEDFYCRGKSEEFRAGYRKGLDDVLGDLIAVEEKAPMDPEVAARAGTEGDIGIERTGATYGVCPESERCVPPDGYVWPPIKRPQHTQPTLINPGPAFLFWLMMLCMAVAVIAIVLLVVTGCEPVPTGKCEYGTRMTTRQIRDVFEKSPRIISVNIETLKGAAYLRCGDYEEPRDLVITPAGEVDICQGDSCLYWFDIAPDCPLCPLSRGPWRKK